MPEARQLQSLLVHGDGRVEVSFIEERHVTRTGIRIQTLQFSLAGLETEFEDAQTAILDLIDAYEVLERNPPPRIPAR